MNFLLSDISVDCLCGLVFRVPGYRFRGPGFDSRRYQIFWEVASLELGPLSLMSTIEELRGRNSSNSGLENREYGRGDQLRWPRDTLYRQKLALTSPTSGSHSVGIVRLRTNGTEIFCLFVISASRASRLQIGRRWNGVLFPLGTVSSRRSNRLWSTQPSDHSPHFNVKVKNVWTYTFTPSYMLMAWCLFKDFTTAIHAFPSQRQRERLRSTSISMPLHLCSSVWSIRLFSTLQLPRLKPKYLLFVVRQNMWSSKVLARL
jgi:hypothetical protein